MEKLFFRKKTTAKWLSEESKQYATGRKSCQHQTNQSNQPEAENKEEFKKERRRRNMAERPDCDNFIGDRNIDHPKRTKDDKSNQNEPKENHQSSAPTPPPPKPHHSSPAFGLFNFCTFQFLHFFTFALLHLAYIFSK